MLVCQGDLGNLEYPEMMVYQVSMVYQDEKEKLVHPECPDFPDCLGRKENQDFQDLKDQQVR